MGDNGGRMSPLSSSALVALRTWRRTISLLGAMLCLATLAVGQAPFSMKTLLGADSQKTASAPTPPVAGAPTTPTAIPLPDVAARSEELKRTLRDITDHLPTQDQLNATKTTLDDRDEQLESRLTEVESLLSGTPSTLELREEENYWRAKQKETSDLRAQLLDWANAAQAGIQQLQAQQPVWNATLQQNQSTPDLGPTLDVINKSVDDLQRVTKQAQDSLRVIVNQQIRAANQDQLALDVLSRIAKARQNLDGRLFERDSLPLWELAQRREIGENKELFLSAANRLSSIRTFAVQAHGAVIALFVLLILSLAAAYRLRLRARSMVPETEAQVKALHIARHWVALGMLPPLLGAYLLAPLAPLPLIGLVILASFIPILILLPPLLDPRFRVLLYCIAGVYAFNALVAWISFSPTHKREMQFLANVLVFCLFAILVRPKRISELEDAGRLHGLQVFAIRAAVVTLGMALVCNLFGYVKLSQFLGVLCIYSTFIAISMLTGVRVFTRLLLEGVDRPAAQELAMVRLHRDSIERWVPRMFQWIGIAVWLFATLNLLGLSDWVAKGFGDVIGFRIAGGSTGITLGGILAFFLILFVGYGISSALRFVLREELLSRFHLSRGLPELISSMLHYLILLLVFFFAVNAGGVELTKFNVLTGALGVGVGFGLQNIVNNFISGIILQFERPIHVGDVLDIDGTTGKVTHIGIRSSTVKTFQGAEVIIPNANFISGKVINWTLSESLRRAELPIGVAYGSDPKLVAKLLEQAATTHESVLTSPIPAVFFKEFADSSLNFELQFWVMQESNVTKVKSEVALAAMDLLDQAEIEIPFPQRDLRLRAVDPDVALLWAKNGSVHSLDDAKPRSIDEAKESGAGTP
jgi:potassium-dependent mechanosensitive channel